MTTQTIPSLPLLPPKPNYLKALEDEYQENLSRQAEKFQCLKMQIQILRKFQQVEKLPIFSQNEKMINKFGERKNQIDEYCANVYLKNKIQLEDEREKKIIIKELEERIFQVGLTLFDKEVQITNDHVGKRKEERICTSNLERFKENQIQMLSLEKFLNLKKKLLLEIKREEKKTKYQKSGKVEKNPQNVEDKGKTGKKMLLVESEKTLRNGQINYGEKISHKVMKLLKAEMLREKQLNTKIHDFRTQFRSLCEKNNELKQKYRNKFKV